MSEKTLAIIKPDAVKKGVIGKIISRIEDGKFKITAMRLAELTKDEAKGFYIVHKDKPFYGPMTDFMSSGPIVLMRLEREDAIAHWRKIMGATDPAKAEPGTLRRLYGSSIENNATHGSDAPETAAWELAYFFKG
jgi:nucleoside-diphosphate kinase